MDTPTTDFVRAGSVEELKAKGRLVVHGPHRPILVVHDKGRVFALDNRCPHMGFPLDRGSVEDGTLTCHWHHARFDLASGCTFDLWADDVPTCPTEVRGGEVWVRPIFGHADPVAHWRQRLDDGLAHVLGLVIAKAVHGQLAAGVLPPDVVRQVALFGIQNRDGWGVGLTILTALGNLLPVLPEEETYLALFHGARRVAADCDGQAPRRRRVALASRPDLTTLKRWLRRWTTVRHREAAERTLLTAVAAGTSPAALAELLLAANTDRAFADGGHSLDFINKAFECLDLIGWQHADSVLPAVVGQMVATSPGGLCEAVSFIRTRRPDIGRRCCGVAATRPPRTGAVCALIRTAGDGQRRVAWLDDHAYIRPSIFKANSVANDHFVARTYLKRWCDRDKNQQIQAYRKPSGTPFQCWPESVCAESDGDLNPNYFKDPAVLGQFRAIFEPRWDAAIDAVEKCKLTIDDKFVIAGYWANLLAATPAWRKIGQKLYEREVLSVLPMITTNLPDSLKGIRLSVEVDENYIKAVATKHLLAGALQLYHQSWTILTNGTAHEFLTSDNPSAVYPPPAPGGPVCRILPLSPRLCISTIMEPPVYRKVVTRADLAEPPKAWITYHRIVPERCWRPPPDGSA